MFDPLESPQPVNQFLEILSERVNCAAKNKESIGLIIIQFADLDRLISTYGFEAGRRAAIELSRRLVSQVREGDLIARISEAKTAVVINRLRNPGILTLAAGKFGKLCRGPIKFGNEEISVQVHMGLASGAGATTQPAALHHDAETALLTSIKDRSEFAVFAPEQRESASNSLQLENELEKAIHEKDFEVHYQPKVQAKDFQVCGAEALLRWNNPRRGPVSPDVFIPLADQPGRIEPLTSFVLSTAIRHAQKWPDSLSVAVNVSAGMLLNSELVEMTGNSLGTWGFEPSRLTIEVTEGALMTDPVTSLKVLHSLRELGINISIDDFGTGYSSLAYFKNIPANELKIDKSFVLNMLHDDGDRRIVNAVAQLAKGFGMEVTAEGVEDRKTAVALAELGCDTLQGFHFARPMPHADLLGWIAQHRAATLN